jgi:hypothetical protein
VLSWSHDVGLWAGEPNGAVWRLDGSDWTEMSPLAGEPQAILATSERLYAAIHESDDSTRIHVSSDGGRSWQPFTN